MKTISILSKVGSEFVVLDGWNEEEVANKDKKEEIHLKVKHHLESTG